METIPRLESERLRLRAIFPEDAEALYQLFSDPKVVQYYDFEPYEDMEQIQNLIRNFTHWFQTDQSYRWGIVRKDNRQLIGTCCFDSFLSRNHSLNFGYDIRSQDWGQGFATEAAMVVIRFAFDQGIVGPVNRIEAKTIPANKASERVLEKLSFVREGTMRQYGFWKGEYHDMNLYSLTKDQVRG